MKKEGIKKILVLALVVMMVFSFAVLAGCGKAKGSGVTEADWNITIKDSSGKAMEFTNADAGEIDMVEVTAVLKKKDGSEITENWKGIPLSEVMKAAGIADYSMVAIEASDGYSQEFEAAAVNDSGTILGFFLNGEEVSVEDGLVQLVVTTMSGKFWISNVAMIEVVD
jgi:DMSO/TMAO reductase YedYZ molybdopterin-dependent catalytic subunit